MQAHGAAACYVCQKHRDPGLMPGGPAGADELVIVSHLAPAAPGRGGGLSISGTCSWSRAGTSPASQTSPHLHVQ